MFWTGFFVGLLSLPVALVLFVLGLTVFNQSAWDKDERFSFYIANDPDETLGER